MSDTRFSELFQKYLQGNASPREMRLLKDLVHNNENTAAHDRLLQQAYMDKSLRMHSEEKVEDVWDALRGRMQENKVSSVHRVHFLKRAWFRYVAIFLLVVGTGTFLYIHQEPKQAIVRKQPITQPDIPPGGNKAILTLADGSTILLDSAVNGQLASQGNAKIVKLGTGSLAYEAGAASVEPMYNTISTPRGGQYQVILPDGSRVWLNAASSITFPTVFTAKRHVVITGEAYLEVAKDAKKPFSVQSGGLDIQVLGTSFNVNAYAEEGAVRTTLLEGSVRIKAQQHIQLLLPGQQSQVTADGHASVISRADTEQALAWKNGLFNFKNADIRTVMNHLARWYNVEVTYEGTIPADRFEGEIPMDAPVSQVLRVLQKNQVHFRIEGKRIIVLP